MRLLPKGAADFETIDEADASLRAWMPRGASERASVTPHLRGTVPFAWSDCRKVVYLLHSTGYIGHV